VDPLTERTSPGLDSGCICGPSIGDKLAHRERFESHKEAKPDMIEDVQTGQLFPVEILLASAEDIRSIGPGWRFDWLAEVRKREVYKVRMIKDPNAMLGLMSVLPQSGFVEIALLESDPLHVGRRKQLKGIAGSLIAFAARLSYRLGNEGFLRLTSKTQLIAHYERAYGFVRQGRSHYMILDSDAAQTVIANFGSEVG
jgi:hypothetical protein